MGSETIYSKHAPLFAVWACRETGVVDALLDGVSESTAIAEETGITDRAADVVLRALLDLGFVEMQDDEYAPTDRLEVLDTERPVPEKGILPHRLDIFENYQALPTVMQTEAYPEVSDRERRNYVGGMAAIGEPVVRAAVSVAERAHPRPGCVLDVGGGIGRFGREFANRGADVTLVDTPAVVERVRPHLADSDIEVSQGDALASLPSGFDLTFCGRLTVSFSPAENERLFANVYDSLRPGGTAVCTEFLRGRSPVAPMFGVHMLAMSETGNTYDEEQYRSWLDRAGFEHPEITDVPGTDFCAVIGRKPE